MGPTQALQIGSALVFSCTEGEVYTRLLSEYRRAEHNMHPTFGDSTALYMFLFPSFPAEVRVTSSVTSSVLAVRAQAAQRVQQFEPLGVN